MQYITLDGASAIAWNIALSSALRLSARLKRTSATPSEMEISTRSDMYEVSHPTRPVDERAEFGGPGRVLRDMPRDADDRIADG
jgi:hypothetical protein